MIKIFHLYLDNRSTLHPGPDLPESLSLITRPPNNNIILNSSHTITPSLKWPGNYRTPVLFLSLLLNHAFAEES